MQLTKIILVITLAFLPIVLCEDIEQYNLEDYISPEDIELFNQFYLSEMGNDTDGTEYEPSTTTVQTLLEPGGFPETQTKTKIIFATEPDCFGLGSFMKMIKKIFWNMKPETSEKLNVEFFVYNRLHRNGVQISNSENEINLGTIEFDPEKITSIIIHGFMSHGKTGWIQDMTKALLDYNDVNVIVVDWRRGGNTWKYWRAVANTHTVGPDVATFIEKIINTTSLTRENFHCIGHSLGAHICSFASNALDGFKRITGLDPAQPCFNSTDLNSYLDKSDAEFVDVIHTNGDSSIIGFGKLEECGHQDFYPNGGIKQPGCNIKPKLSFGSVIAPFISKKLSQAICNHGRAYLLFTESLKRNNCSLIARQWSESDPTGRSNLQKFCNETVCSELGIRSDISQAQGSFFLETLPKQPYCAEDPVEIESRKIFFSFLKERGFLKGFSLGEWFGNIVSNFIA